MPYYPQYDLTNQYITSSFQNLLQLFSNELVNGSGSSVWTLVDNSDFQSVSSSLLSHVNNNLIHHTTQSLKQIFVTSQQTGSMSVLSSSFSTTASYALDLSNEITSLYVRNYQTSSFVLNSYTSSMSVLTSSYSHTASYALNAGSSGNINTSSFATTGSNIFTGSQIICGSVNIYNGNITASQARLTAGAQSGYVLTSDSTGNASWQPSSSGSVASASYASTSSYSHNAVTASYAINASGLFLPEYDYSNVTYTAGGRASYVVYKRGGATGSLVARVDLTYDSNGWFVTASKTIY